MESENNQSVTI